MNVTTLDGLYRVTDPQGAKFYVRKDKGCTCGAKPAKVATCPHGKAVSAYLEMHGQVAQNPCEPVSLTKRQEWEQRVSNFREKRVLAIASGNITPMLAYFLELSNLNSDNAESFIKKWQLP